jgi:hypothetical protein
MMKLEIAGCDKLRQPAGNDRIFLKPLHINYCWNVNEPGAGNFTQPKIFADLFIFKLLHVIITATQYRVTAFSEY